MGRTLTLIRLVEGRSEDTVRLRRADGSEVTLASGHFHAFLERIVGIKRYRVISDGESCGLRRSSARHIGPSCCRGLKRTRRGVGAAQSRRPPRRGEILDRERIERDPNHRSKFKIVINEATGREEARRPSLFLAKAKTIIWRSPPSPIIR